MKPLFQTMLLVLVTAILCAIPVHAQKEFKDTDAVATINGTVVTYGEYSQKYNKIKDAFYTKRGLEITPEQDKKLKDGILDELIAQELLAQQAVKKNIQVADQDVEKEIELFAARMGGKEKFEEQTKKVGMTVDEFRRRVKRQMMIQKLITTESEKETTPTIEAQKAYYESNSKQFDEPEAVKAGQIVVRLNENASKEDEAAARKRIEEAQQKIKSGMDFAEVAKKYSESPTASKGGDVGWVPKGNMEPELEKTVYSLKPGQVTDIMKTPYGFHIIKVYEVRQARHIPFEEAQQKVLYTLKTDKLRPWVKKYVDTLRSEAKVEVLMQN